MSTDAIIGFQRSGSNFSEDPCSSLHMSCFIRYSLSASEFLRLYGKPASDEATPPSPPSSVDPLPTNGTDRVVQSVIRGAWRPYEDDLLRIAVSRCGTCQWSAVAALIPGRTATQCRERWMFRIAPGLNKTPFQHWEDELIVREREKFGNRWSSIATQLPGRTSCAVKNRWHSALKRRKAGGAADPPPSPDPFNIANLLSRPVQRRA
jgi:hypothetical protein